MSQNRPNIVLITSDQQRCDSLGCYGSAFVRTPHLDRLAAEGAVFQRAYCANPVCTPARASIFCGQYLTRHAAWNVGLNVPAQTPMISHTLAHQAGYRTHYVGKAHFQAFSGGAQSWESILDWERTYAEWHGPYYGFETVELSLGHVTYGLRGHYGLWLKTQLTDAELKTCGRAARADTGPLFGGEAYDWDLPTRLHSSTWTADRAIAYIREHGTDRPFLLAVGFQDPHHPHCVPRDAPTRVSPDAVPLPRYRDGELDDKPPHFRAARHGRLEDSRFRGAYAVAGQGHGFDYTQVGDAQARLARAYYHSMVGLIDREVGRILDCLREQGLDEQTLVLFTTDHGELLGDHGLWMKGPFHYEELVRIPLLMRWPGGIPAGRAIRTPVSQVDLVPTILGALGEPATEVYDGLDLMPLLTEGHEPPRDHVMVECVDDPGCLRLKTVVTANRKLTLYHGEAFGELYDLELDPGEVRNLWDEPSYQQDKSRLLAKVADHLERLEPRVARLCYA